MAQHKSSDHYNTDWRQVNVPPMFHWYTTNWCCLHWLPVLIADQQSSQHNNTGRKQALYMNVPPMFHWYTTDCCSLHLLSVGPTDRESWPAVQSTQQHWQKTGFVHECPTNARLIHNQLLLSVHCSCLLPVLYWLLTVGQSSVPDSVGSTPV